LAGGGGGATELTPAARHAVTRGCLLAQYIARHRPSRAETTAHCRHIEGTKVQWFPCES